MKYTINFFGINCRKIWEGKKSKNDLINTLEALDIIIGYKSAPSLNKKIREVLKKNGECEWEEEAPSDFFHYSELDRTGKKEVDLRNAKDKVDVEIEMGNVASAYRDLIKFNLHYNARKIDLGVIILCCSEATNIMGENIARAERTIDELKVIFRNDPQGQCPIVVIGLEPYDNEGNSLIDSKAKTQLKELQEKRKKKK